MKTAEEANELARKLRQAVSHVGDGSGASISCRVCYTGALKNRNYYCIVRARPHSPFHWDLKKATALGARLNDILLKMVAEEVNLYCSDGELKCIGGRPALVFMVFK